MHVHRTAPLVAITSSLLIATAHSQQSPSPAPQAPPAPAEQSAPPQSSKGTELHWYWKDGLRSESDDGAFKFKIGGRILWDNAWITADDDLTSSGLGTEDGSEFRQARLSVAGSFEEYFYKAEYDFAGDPDFKDVYLGRNDVLGEADVRAGHFKEPFSLDQLNSLLYTTFMERGLSDAFAPARNAGVALSDSFANDHLTWSAGVFRTVDDLGVGQTDGGYSVTGRVAGAVIQNDAGEPLLHAGVSVSGRDGDDVAFSQRPESHLASTWVNTGTLASEEVLLAGVELATVLGPVHAAAEYVQADVGLQSGAGSDPTFDGYYVQVGWFLTGEHRAYSKTQATFDRTKPKQSWSDARGGLGAWEVAARYSSIDLTDENVAGGELEDVTLGLNWYLNPNMRAMFNYVRPDLDSAGADGAGDIFMIRLQVDW